MKRLITVLVAGVVFFTAALACADISQPISKILTSFDFNVVGLGLNASPEYQAVPKGIASRVDATFDVGSFNAADIIAQLPPDYTVRAELSGPGFQPPLALVAKPGRPFELPTLAVLGKYTLANIRLVDGKGQTLFGAVPQAVAIESIPDPLVTSVTTRPLTTEELKERGVTFDSSNFTAYQFTAGIATQSGQVPLNLPVIIPNSSVVVMENPPEVTSSEPVFDLPPVPEVPTVALPQNLSVQPFLMQVEEKEVTSQYQIPPIPGIVVIPGNIGFLNQYFSALAIVTNGAPLESKLNISNVQAKIVLPLGEDMRPNSGVPTDDDPLRMASSNNIPFPKTMNVLNVGPDGKAGTADDVGLLHPAESGQADFTIEGVKEGSHKLDFEITATLEGLPIGPVTLKGKATGAVLVRNPNFSLTLGHPATIRSGEEYDLFITVTNTGKVPANLVTVSLDPRALSGAAFAAGEVSEKSIETIAAGSAATVKYRLKAQRTGKVTANAFESSEMRGKFVLRTGVGELNIPLSPDSLILPYTADLPPDLLTAAMSLLGQAWSVATAPAGALPADVLPITKSIVSARAFDLSEAGLRIALGDTELKAVEDLAFDLMGSDNADAGFDDLRRRSTQGVELNRALAAIFKKEADASGLMQFQKGYAEKVSYRPRHISVVTSSAPIRVRLTDPSGNMTGGLSAGEARREVKNADQLLLGEDSGVRSTLTLAAKLDYGNYKVEVAAESDTAFDLGVVVPDAAGIPQQLVFNGVLLPTGAKATLTLHPGMAGAYLLSIDHNGDGIAETQLSPASVLPIPDQGPKLVAATQLVPGFGPGGDKHGRNVAVLFSQRVTKETAQNLANYGVDENRVSQVNLQPGSRMAFLLLRDGIGPFFDRNLTTSGLANGAGLVMESDTRKIVTTAKGPAAVVNGAVRTARGEPVPNATVKLYQLVWYDDGISIEERYALFSEKNAGADGKFQFDYVLQNNDPTGPFKLEGVNPATNEVGSITTGVSYNNQRLALDIFMKARGSVSGTVKTSSGTVVAGAAVLLTTLNDNRSYSTTSDGNGAFSISGVSVGAFSVKVVHPGTLSEGRAMGTIADDGGTVVQDVVIYRLADVAKGNVAGKVLGGDGVTPRSGIIVIVEATNYRNWVRTGADGAFVFNGVFAGSVKITARDDASGELNMVSGVINDGATSVLNVILKGTGSVTGRVQRGDNKSVEGLYVIARVNQIVKVLQTDAAGAFTFSGLSTGEVRLEVLDPKDFNRTVATGAVTLFSAGETVSVYLYVPEKALATATIQGTVYSRTGTPLANAEVRQLMGEFSFYIFKSDTEGKYTIPNVPLGTYRIVAISGNEVANGTATVWYDTQVKELNLYSAGIGKVTGTTYDDAEKTVRTGANVTLISTKPNEVGWLVYDSRFPSVAKSDPETGRFTFAGVYAGSVTVTSSSILRPTPVSASGSIASNNDVLNLDLVLKGEPPRPGEPPVNQPGSISGKVLLPNGSPAGPDIRVTVNIDGADVTSTTEADGTFRFPFVTSGNKQLTAEDPVTLLTGRAYVSVPAGLDVPVTIRLLGTGSVTVRTLDQYGNALKAISVQVSGSSFPNKDFSGATDESGSVTFYNVPEGSYAVSADGSFGRGGVTIPADNKAVSIDLKLDPSGSVTGKFFKADGTNVIQGGQIKLKQGGQVIAYTTSLSDGTFRVENVPLGDFTLEGFEPTSGRTGFSGGRVSTGGQTVSSDITVTPQGTVKGNVLNYSGTAPVSGATVAITVSGVASYSYSTVSAPDGSFLFAGVPAGRFTVDATDPGNGLRGNGSGSITYEREIVQTEIHIAPTGSIEGKLLMPDGTHASSGTVTITGGASTQINPETGGFRFTNLAAGKSYTLSATQPSGLNPLRSGSAVATVTQDGEVAVVDIVLRGIGIVKGTVTVDGEPLDGAKVTITVAGVSHDASALNGGFYRFENIPAGPFTVKAVHFNTLIGTSASASGYLNNEDEEVTVNLTLAAMAAITGKVVLADGVTSSAGGGVRFTGCGRTFTTVTSGDGTFGFENIPLQCSFLIETEDALGLGIGKYSGTLAAGEKNRDIGTIVLDDKPITIAAVDPADGSANVPITKAIKVVFSEAADPGTVNSSNIYLTRGGSHVSGSLVLDADGKGVTFTPSQPLSGFALYSLAVSTGVRDLIGRTLPQNFTSSFTTVDNVPPRVLSVSPANGTVEVASDGVIRVTFSETIDPAGVSGIRLMSGGSDVATTVDLVQGDTVAILTPSQPLAPNAAYSVQVSAVADSVGNLMSGSWQSSFNTVDTIVPTIIALTVPANADMIQGNAVEATAAVADSDVALVDFYLDDIRKATVSAAPFKAQLTLPAAGRHSLKAIAQDKVGHRGVPFSVDLDVKEDAAPQVAITSPADGSVVGTGQSVGVSVTATDDLSARSITLTVTGEINTVLAATNVSGKQFGTSFNLNVPAEITSGGTIQLSAVAKDSAGNSSPPAVRTLTVKDTIAPIADSLTSPGENVLYRYKPGQSGSATFSVTDNIGVTSVTCSASGAATGSGTFTIAPAQKQLSQPFSFTVAGDAAPHSTVSISCTAFDATGNQAAKSLNLMVADTVPPQALHASIANGATNVPVNSIFSVEFSEPLDSATVSTGSVTLADAAGNPIAGGVTLSGDRRSITFTPAAPLSAGASYTLSIGTAVKDDAGNRLAEPYQLSFSTDNTAASVLSVTPAAGSINVGVGTSIGITFNEALDPVSLTADKFILSSSFGQVPGTLSLSSNQMVATFYPSGQLSFSRDYTITVKAGVKDISGNATTTDYSFAFKTQAANSDLVGLWTMDGDWSDSSGKGNNGTPYGPTFSSERVGGVFSGSFDGVNDYISIPPTASLSPASAITVEAWVKPADIATWHQVVTKRFSESYDPYNSFILTTNDGKASNKWAFYISNGTAGTQSGAVDTNVIVPNAWTHLVGTYDGYFIRLYVNGVLKAVTAKAGDIGYNSTLPLRIGTSNTAGGQYFKGLIDEVAIYSSALPAEDVLEHYNFLVSGDRTPPAPPTVDPVAASGYQGAAVLSGTKEVNTSIRINGKQVVANDLSTTWQAAYPLNLGQNILEIESRDTAGNKSIPVIISVVGLQDSSAIAARWRLEGNWNEDTGLGIYGVPNNGATFAAGVMEGSLAASFDGIDDSVWFSRNKIVSAPNNFTMEFWAYPTATRNVTSENGGTTEGISGQRYAINPINLGDADSGAGVSVGTNGVSVFEAGNYYLPSLLVHNTTLTGWTHIAVVYQDKRPSLYINGNFVRTGLRSNRVNVYPSVYLSNSGGYGPYKGLVDEYIVYKRALTSDEVRAHVSMPPVVKITDTPVTPRMPGETGQATVTVTHGAGLTNVTCTASGAATGSRVTQLDPAQGLFADTFAFQVSENAPSSAAITLTCSATDVTGLVGRKTVTLAAADTIGPAITATSIQDNATNVAATTSVAVTFNEAIDRSSAMAGITMVNSATGQSIAGTVTLSSDSKTITFAPTTALDGSTTYVLTVTTLVTDIWGNQLPQQRSIRFTTQAVAALVISSQGSSSSPYVVATGRYSTISISNSYVVFDGAVAADSVSLSSGSTLSHYGATSTTAPKLDITTGSLNIDSSSLINVTGKGYLGGWQGSNSGSSMGRTLLNTTTGGSTSSNGGSYGGLGGVGNYGGSVNVTYGGYADPNDLGSGGGTYNSSGNGYYGGNGGGLIRLSAGTINLAGHILADGGAPSGYYDGGGSGGGIRIDVGTLSGTGTISAKGGSGGNYAGGGGGGRIAIYYDALTLPVSNITATGGAGGSSNYSGGAGTIYRKLKSADAGTLYVDNKNLTAPNWSTPLPSVRTGVISAITANTLTRSSGSWQPGALKGLKVKPNATRDEVFTIVDNTATALTTDPAEGDLAGIASVGSGYSGIFVANDDMVITGKSSVTSGDPLIVNGSLTISGAGGLSADPVTVITGKQLVVDGGTLYGDAKGITADAVILKKGGVITCLDATTTTARKLVLNATTLNIDATSKIDVSRKGYLGGWQSNNGSSKGLTRAANGTIVAGSTDSNGGTFGGTGGIGLYGGSVNATYGDYLDPNDVGSGGGTYNSANNGYYGGNGGGLLRLSAQSIILAGNILANGGDSSNYYDGGGSGGGIRIDVGTLSGTGSISAQGGSGGYYAGSGGGGRIAVYYDSMTLPTANIVSSGGTSSNTNYSGGAGTVYRRLRSAPGGTLYIDNRDHVTATSSTVMGTVSDEVIITGKARITSADDLLLNTKTTITGGATLTVKNLTVAEGIEIVADGGTIVSDTINADRVTLKNGGVITCPDATTTATHSLVMQVTNLSVDSTSKIDVSRKGYLGGWQGSNSGSATGRTLLNTTSGGSGVSNGGSYGGSGGTGNNGGSVNVTYGNYADPNQFGSGGGTYNSANNGYYGGNGGGLLRLTAESIQLAGSMLADGGDSSNYYDGGGSGGGIRIEVGTLSGTGSVRAKGGSGGYYAGGGGGGRIAVYYDTLTLPTANISTAGGRSGNSYYSGGAGTVYRKLKSASAGTLYIENKNLESWNWSTPLPAVRTGSVGAVTATTLTRSSGSWQPGALKGLRIKPDTARNELFTIVDNTATMLTIDASEGDLTQVTAVGSQYSGVFVANDEVIITGKASATSTDPLVMNGRLTISGGAALYADPLTMTTGNDLVIDGGILYGDAKGITADALNLKNGGRITCQSATTSVTRKVVLTAATLTIDASSSIDVSGKGYLGGWQGGNGSSKGLTRAENGAIVAGSTDSNGGSYGGTGGIGQYGGSVNATYGNSTDPNEVGSGGGTYNYANNGYYGGNGGGLLRLSVGSIQLAGSITANGNTGQGYYDGGGSGGGIRIDVGTLSGTGTITANGGPGGYYAGGGGGGRIAIFYNALSLPSTKILTTGGAGLGRGTEGTIYLHQQ